MENSPIKNNKEVIGFPRYINSEEIINLVEYLAKDLFISTDYWMGEAVSLNPEEGKIREYKGYLQSFEGHFYRDRAFNYFKCDIHKASHLTNAFKFKPYHYPLSHEETRLLWEDIRNSTNKYFSERHFKKRNINRFL